jgi:hypothetical protein
MRYIILFFALFFAACSSNDPYKKLDRLSGLWQTDTGEGLLYEEWTKSDNNVMHGKSYMINGSDSMVFERVELSKKDSGVYYIPTVKDQNQSRPVYFKLISSNDTAYTFENKAHDFPQRIIYRFVGNDSIVARIEGDVKGSLQYQEYFYSRVKK